MEKTEVKATDGDPVRQSPAAEVKTALAGFVSEFKEFQNDIFLKVKQQEERLTMLDRKSFSNNRPALSVAAET